MTWDHFAEIAGRYLGKGRQVAIDGRFQTVAAITFGATAGAVLFALAFPQVVMVIIGVWVAVLLALFAMLGLAEMLSRRANH